MYKKGFGIVIPATASIKVPVFKVEIENVLKKMQKVVKIFRRSPVKKELAEICVAGTKQRVVTCLK